MTTQTMSEAVAEHTVKIHVILLRLQSETYQLLCLGIINYH